MTKKQLTDGEVVAVLAEFLEECAADDLIHIFEFAFSDVELKIAGDVMLSPSVFTNLYHVTAGEDANLLSMGQIFKNAPSVNREK